MTINVTFAKSASDLEKWNAYVLDTPSASFFIVSHWFDGYTAYGMRTHYLMAQEPGGQVVGGAALAEFRLGPFMWIDVMHSPIVTTADPEIVRKLIATIEDYAQAHGAMVVQISPFEPSRDQQAVEAKAQEKQLAYAADVLSDAVMGVSHQLQALGYTHARPISVFVRGPGQGQIVDLQMQTDDLLMTFRKGTRRDIRYSLASDLLVTQADSLERLEAAYTIMKENAEQQHYAIRTWDSFRDAVWPGIQANQVVVFIAELDNQPVATVLVLFGGRRGSYVMGGTRRIDAKKAFPAHRLQFEAMKEAHARGYTSYDLTAIAADGVADFKRGFRPVYYELVGTYSKVYRQPMLRAFLLGEPVLRRNRRRFARVLQFAKSRFKR